MHCFAWLLPVVVCDGVCCCAVPFVVLSVVGLVCLCCSVCVLRCPVPISVLFGLVCVVSSCVFRVASFCHGVRCFAWRLHGVCFFVVLFRSVSPRVAPFRFG